MKPCGESADENSFHLRWRCRWLTLPQPGKPHSKFLGFAGFRSLSVMEGREELLVGADMPVLSEELGLKKVFWSEASLPDSMHP